jgi:hypothetical protein
MMLIAFESTTQLPKRRAERETGLLYHAACLCQKIIGSVCIGIIRLNLIDLKSSSSNG